MSLSHGHTFGQPFKVHYFIVLFDCLELCFVSFDLISIILVSMGLVVGGKRNVVGGVWAAVATAE